MLLFQGAHGELRFYFLCFSRILVDEISLGLISLVLYSKAYDILCISRLGWDGIAGGFMHDEGVIVFI
jgi:hypothetical protein